MHFDSILAVSDFTALSSHALERAAQLARQHQAILRLVHVAEGPTTFLTDPVARLAHRARQLARRHEISAHAIERSASLNEVLAEASASTLLVMGPLLQRSWKRFHLGTTLDQAVHGSVCPLLVVKQAPVRPYEKVLVAVDLSPHSKSLIDFASLFSAPTVLKLFHAIDTIEDAKLRSANVSPDVIQASRLGSRHQARDRLMQLVGGLTVERPASAGPPLVFEVGNGDPAYSTALHQQATQADLVVVGKRRGSALTQFFTGSVAQRLAKWAAGDVLIAPLDQLHAAATADTGWWMGGRDV
ncbi:universal stress protein [Hydrogenophaga sp. PBL-H3]|uniref:universal stress protein n=1 Tax=Hydrogenophaga sp. PBL-H3 TaxID=434010 RepID=UPI00131FEEF9|nr:universal stress protein [Hydrogenophaga sp. PBL-H3]QHE77745.1 universal stress protein [Hydrogenophaga sp. PBL-H3]QHE82169.1 universal stress protein [Hydrogenophaga sp. PBL-H3]